MIPQKSWLPVRLRMSDKAVWAIERSLRDERRRAQHGVSDTEF